MINAVKLKSWPQSISKTLQYRLGEKPLHDYLIHNGENYSNETAYIFYGHDITWGQLSNDTRRFARFLQAQGVVKGDRIGLFMQNCPQYLISHYAVQMLGAIVVPLNPMYKESELEYLMNEVEIKAVVVGEELYPLIDAVKSKVESLAFTVSVHYADYLADEVTIPIPDELKIEKQVIEHAHSFIEVIKEHDPLSRTAKVDLWNDIGLMVFTSGTTGRPKAAMLTFGNALFKTAATSNGYTVMEKDKTLAVAPLCHIAGMLMGVNIPIYSRSSSVLMTRFEPEAVITAIETYRLNKIYTIAPMNAAILQYPSIEKRDLTSLELNFATSFGIPVDEKLANAWKQLTNGCLMFEASYGLSETHTADTFMPIDNIKFGTCGIPTYDTDIRIVDIESGRDLSPGEQGEIVVKSPGVFKGYLNRPDATSESLRDGWVYTGDIGKIDEDGYLYFIGRLKEMIKSSGYSVFPEDVEALMKEHEAILQVAVIGVPDEVRGENVKAFIVLKPDYVGKISEEEIINWAKENMAAYKYPREVEFRDSLPATSSGKVLRRLLKDQ
ncbi:AMP-binding protein [Pueribacillus sp. YX66]|uniref:AMP-binding protein n=1 Tax=Pueribacillus sp. YX66 TaxID=3229242 RepID=UPI00358D36E3